MKTKLLMIITMVLCAGIFVAHAADKKHLGGPKGGRLLEKTEPIAEFLLEKDRTVTITFYDSQLKPVAAGEQVVTVIANTKDGKKSIGFDKKGDILVSKEKLPEEEGYDIVVQVKERAEAKPQNLRFKLDTHTCGGCKRAEYACTCDE